MTASAEVEAAVRKVQNRSNLLDVQDMVPAELARSLAARLDALTNAGPQAGQETSSAPSQEGHAAGLAASAPSEGTPRTDEQERSASSMATYPNKVVKASFARLLEAELTAAQERVRELELAADDANLSRIGAEEERDALKHDVTAAKERS
jgi:hypothetical protein